MKKALKIGTGFIKLNLIVYVVLGFICLSLLIVYLSPSYTLTSLSTIITRYNRTLNAFFVGNRSNEHGNSKTEQQLEERKRQSNQTKLILFWSTYYKQKRWFRFTHSDYDNSFFRQHSCSYTNCQLTHNHSRLQEADMLLFYFSDAPNWPRRRYSHQYYVHGIWEASRKRGNKTFLDKFEGKINVTLNYRHDADIHAPYGHFVPASNQSAVYKRRVPLSARNKTIVWPVSHCKTFSLREQYVKELSKYIDVDIIGACGQMKCPRSVSKSCFKSWQNTYKFVLAFENNICLDYITEKLYNVLNYELIPVVLGGGNYTRDAPPHSFINARDFNTPKDLAQFLHQLAADEERYYSYFQWKSKFTMLHSISVMMCRLCEAVHRLPRRRPARINYADYWFGRRGETCDNELIPRMRKTWGW